jgi:hypothetical protein
MALVAAASADYRPYLLDVELTPRAVTPGQPVQARFRVLEPGTRQPVSAFEPIHEKVFHLFVVGHDLQHFAHLHPELRSDGSLDIAFEVPRSGAYRFIADFLPIGGAPQLLEKSFVTAGYAGPLVPAGIAPDIDDEVVGATRVRLISPPSVAGREQLVTFELADAASGEPVADLEPYLGATGHLLVLSADLSVAFHSHPVASITSAFGPSIVFQMLFPRPGVYKLWMQYQRNGTIGTASFALPVQERPIRSTNSTSAPQPAPVAFRSIREPAGRSIGARSRSAGR